MALSNCCRAVTPGMEVKASSERARKSQRLVRELESEHRAQDESQITWTPDALRAILRHLEVTDQPTSVHARDPPAA